MKPSTKLSSAFLICSVVLTGCGSPTGVETTPPKQAEVTTTPAVDSAPPSSQATSPSVVNDNSKQGLPNVESEQSLPQVVMPKTVSTVQVQSAPTTAIEAIAVVNLRELPRLNETSVLQSSATYLHYSGEGKLTEADVFYKKELATKGWKEIPPLSPPTEQFIDRLFEKNGYYLRVTLSQAGEAGQLSMMLANLGNVDVRSLPKLPDADSAKIPSTPVNFTYKSSSSIQVASDAILKQMAENGWQRWDEFNPIPMDVPHYLDLRFRKEACLLSVGIIRDNQNPSDKTTVFYHAAYVMPFDIPTTDVSQVLKLDLSSERAAFQMGNSRKELVSLLKANSKKFGWKIGSTERFEAGEEHLLPIDLKSGAYMVARLVESEGKYSASLENFGSAPKAKQSEDMSIASNESQSGSDKTTETKDRSFEDFTVQIDSTIQAEISKALGSINSPGNGAKDLAALQAMAQELSSQLGAVESADGDDEGSDKEKNSINPFDVPEDSIAPSPKSQSINKSVGTLKHDGKTYQLEYVACYVLREFGEPKKCVLFSDRPIDVEKLKRMLLEEGKPIYGMYVSDEAANMLNFRISEESVSIDAKVGSLSMGIGADKIDPPLSYFQGKIAGKINMPELIKVNGSTMEFTAELNLPVIQVDWAKRNSPEAKKLVVDASQDCLIPEGCSNFSSEGSKYSKKIEATLKAPIAVVQAFYEEQLEAKGWKSSGNTNSGFKKYRTNEQEMALKLESVADTCKIEMQVRNSKAAKADAMVPPAGKVMLVLGNMSDSKIQMTIAGRTYQVSPSDGQNPKDATKVVVEPGAIKVQVTGEKGTQRTEMKVDASANSTWGVLFDTSFQDVMRLF